MKLKYCIQAYLNSLTREEHTIIMRKLLLAIAPTQRSTFHRWRMIQENEKPEIPASKLQAIAHVIGCEPEDLIQGLQKIKRQKK